MVSLTLSKSTQNNFRRSVCVSCPKHVLCLMYMPVLQMEATTSQSINVSVSSSPGCLVIVLEYKTPCPAKGNCVGTYEKACLERVALQSAWKPISKKKEPFPCVTSQCDVSNHSLFWNLHHTGHTARACLKRNGWAIRWETKKNQKEGMLPFSCFKNWCFEF